MPPLTLSTKALSNRSGLAVRQVQTLTDARALLADEGTETPGRGGSRQYPLFELDVAMLLAPITHKGMSATEARGIATTLRRIVRAPDDLGFKGLEQARKLRSYLNSWLAMRGLPHGSIPDPHHFMHHSGIIAGLQPQWGHVEPTEDTLKTIQAWIILELAKRGDVDPIMFLYRGPGETWCYEFWAILTVPDDGRHDYRYGNTLIEVKHIEPKRVKPPEGNDDLQFDDILIELKRHKSRHRKNRRGGFVIMPRSVYQESISTD